MAKFSFFTAEEGKEVKAWFPFDEDTEVLIRFQSKGQIRKIFEKATKAKRLSKSLDVQDYSNILLGRGAVESWRKMDDHNHPGLIVKGQPFPFSQENLDLLMSNSLQFSAFVNERCTDPELFDLEDETEIKND